MSAPVIDILIPTYGRADRIRTVVENIRSTTSVPHTIYFGVEDDDVATMMAINQLSYDNIGYVVNQGSKSYSGAINTMYRNTLSPYLFAGSDDVEFQTAWDTEALNRFDGWVEVVGTLDGINPYVNAGSHATHYLVARNYLDRVGGVVDEGPGSFLYEGYGHNYCDTEFIGTAKMRAKFHPCFTSRVLHKHWSAGFMAPDATTDKANSTYAEDSALYDSRRELWQQISR